MKTKKKKSHDPAPASPRYYNLTKIYIWVVSTTIK